MDGTNLYAYAGNDPVNFYDPTGLARTTEDNPGLGNSDGVWTMLAASWSHTVQGFRDSLALMKGLARGLREYSQRQGEAASLPGSPMFFKAMWDLQQGVQSVTEYLALGEGTLSDRLSYVANKINPFFRILEHGDAMLEAAKANDWETVGYELVKSGEAAADTVAVAVTGAKGISAGTKAISAKLPSFKPMSKGGLPDGWTLSYGEGYGSKPRLDFHTLPKGPSPGAKGLIKIVQGRRVVHYHRKGPGGMGLHRPFQTKPSWRWWQFWKRF